MAAVDMFLKLDGIEGESQDSKHKGEINISSYSLGSSSPSNFNSRLSGGGGGAGKVSFQDLHFTKVVDKATTNLMLACCNGKHISNGVLTVRKAGENPVEFLVYKLTDVIVSSYQTGGSNGSSVLPTDQFSISFAKIEIDYKVQNPDGTLGDLVSAGWDLRNNVIFNPNPTIG